MKSILNMFDDDVVCSVYRQANTKKDCKCNCVNQDVVEVKEFTREPPFSWTGLLKDGLEIDYDLLENGNFHKEIFSYAKYTGQ